MEACYCAEGSTTSSAQLPHSDDGTQDDFGPGEQIKFPEDSEDSSSSELKMSQFKDLVSSLFRASAGPKMNLRRWVLEDVAVGRRLSERIECILEYAITSTKPSRLDDAIDILDQDQVDLVTYLRNAQHQGMLENKDDDAIYVLVRAAGRRSDDAASIVLPWAIENKRASVREAAVEALSDLGTADAIAKIRRLAESENESSAVRKAAKEALSDIDED